jgi:hypothetical protein
MDDENVTDATLGGRMCTVGTFRIHRAKRSQLFDRRIPGGHMKAKAQPAFRRTKRTALAVGAIAALTVVATDPGSAAPVAATQTTFNNGTGAATADSVRVDPIAGGLSFGIGVGQALAGHQNTVAQAESRAFDLGVPGVTLAGEACDGGDPTLAEKDQPQPEQVSSTDEGSEDGRHSTESFAGGQISKSVWATDDPKAEALTVGAPFEIPGVLSVGGTRAYSRSGVVDGAVREATAVSEVQDLSFAADAVQIKGLRWEAIQRTGGVEEKIGTFTVESLRVAGVPVPVEDLGQLNAVLEPIGFQLRIPKTRVVNTTGGEIVIVDPLAIAVIPNEARDTVLGAVLGAGQPVREPLADALIDFDCGNATYVTLADVGIASISGGGTLSVSLGGVRATTAAIKLFDGLGQLPPLAPLSPLGSVGLGTPGTPGRAAVPGTPGTTTAGPSSDTTDDGDTATGPLERIGDITGERGGAMALVSAGGLLMLLGVAEGDRRKMRAAQRSIPLEV